MKLHHFAIEVKNIDESIAFYTEKLGFKIDSKIKIGKSSPKTGTDDLFYVYLKYNSGVCLELVEIWNKREDRKVAHGVCPHIAIATDNFENTLKTLENNNVEIFDGPHIISDDVKIVIILDPDGYRIDIVQLLK